MTHEPMLLYGKSVAPPDAVDTDKSAQTEEQESGTSFARAREAPVWVVVTALILIIASTAALNLIVFARDYLTPLRQATSGLISPTLIANVGMFVLFVHLFIRHAGRLTYNDIGLRRRALRPALLVTALVWITIQVAGIVWSFITTGGIALDVVWQQGGATFVLGNLMGQMAGNALFEETVYRGFLLPQTLQKLGKAMQANGRTRLVVAVVLSQLVFALIHIPGRLLQGMEAQSMAGSLGLVFLLGVMFAIMYVRTGNLYICVGVHALVNVPACLFGPQGIGTLTAIALAVSIITLGPRVSFGRLSSTGSP